MGVDWYACEGCGKTFPDCGHYATCGEDCYRRWCSEECGQAYDEAIFADEEEGGTTCKFCRGDDTEDAELLSFLLDKSKWSRKQAVKAYKRHRKNLKRRAEK